MIGKNLLTVLIAVVVLSAAFFGYQHFTKSKDLEAHHENSNLGLIEAAKKSPRAGLAQMGRAINKYYAENKSYPTSLDTLYPKYMNSKSFINDINWNYRPTGNNFLLTKNTLLGNRTVVASIDKGLRVRMGASTTVALVDRKLTAAPATTTPGRTAELKTGTASEAPAEGISATTGAPDEKIQKPEDIALSKSQIQTVVIDESETPSGFVSELSNAYLVWKDLLVLSLSSAMHTWYGRMSKATWVLGMFNTLESTGFRLQHLTIGSMSIDLSKKKHLTLKR